MLAIIGSKDLTQHINSTTYSMNSEKEYKEWQDGNYNNHRRYTRDRIKGSFDIVLSEPLGFTAEEFLALLDEHSTNGLLLITVFVRNTCSEETINAYYTVKSKKQNELAGGEPMDIFTITLEER